MVAFRLKATSHPLTLYASYLLCLYLIDYILTRKLIGYKGKKSIIIFIKGYLKEELLAKKYRLHYFMD